MQVKPRFLNTRAGDSDDEPNIPPFRGLAPVRDTAAVRREAATDETEAALSGPGAAAKPGIFGYLYERKTTVCIVAIVVVIVIILGYIFYQYSSTDAACTAGGRKAPRTRPVAAGASAEGQRPVGRAVPQRLKDMAKAAQAAASGAANALTGSAGSNAAETPQLTVGDESAPESSGDKTTERPPEGEAHEEEGEEEEGENEPAELQEDDLADGATEAQD